MKRIKLKDLIKENKKIENFLVDLGKVNMEGWSTKGDDFVIIPKNSRFDEKVVSKLAKKHGLTFDIQDTDAVVYLDL